MLDSELPKTIFPLFISDDILEIVPIDASKFAESFVLVCIFGVGDKQAEARQGFQ